LCGKARVSSPGSARCQGTWHDTCPPWVYNLNEKAEKLIDLPIEEAILIECNALAWRSLAISQELHEKLANAPLAPAARLKPIVVEYKPIKILSYGRNKVGVVKAIREISGYDLKRAIDAVNNVPSDVEYKTSWTRDAALNHLVQAGATVE
jgi:ribosomal protein L7/L12